MCGLFVDVCEFSLEQRAKIITYFSGAATVCLLCRIAARRVPPGGPPGGPLISLSLTPITLLLTALQTHHTQHNTHTPRRSFRPYDSLAVTRTASGTVSSTLLFSHKYLSQKALLL